MKRALRACLIAGMAALGLASHADGLRPAEPGALADKSIEELQQIIVEQLAVEIFCHDEERCFDTMVNDDLLQPRKKTLLIAVLEPESTSAQPLWKIFDELHTKCTSDGESVRKER